jgi:hypothetical protein
MNDGYVLIVFLLVALALLWFFVWGLKRRKRGRSGSAKRHKTVPGVKQSDPNSKRNTKHS